MKRLLSILLIIFFNYNLFSQYENIVKDLKNKLNYSNQIKLAVLTFSYIDGFESVGSRVIQEKMINAFQKEKNIVLVERGLLSKVLEEKKLEMSGLFDDKTVSEVGKFLGVDAVLTGTLNDVDEKRVEVNARIINVLTGEIMASSSIIVEKTWKDSIPKANLDLKPLSMQDKTNLPDKTFAIENFEDIDNLELYDEVVKYDRSEANPLEKAVKWKEFGFKSLKYKDMALKRAKEWEDYDKAEKERKRLEEEKAEMMKKDYEKLKKYLSMDVINEKQKEEFARKFMSNYGGDIFNIYREEVLKYITRNYDFVDEFKEELARFSLRSKFGFINKIGEIVIENKYDYVEQFSNGLAKVKINNKYGFINKEGKAVIKIEYDDVFDLYEGVSVVKKDGKYGLVNLAGKVILTPQYDNIQQFSEGLAAVEKNGRWGYINTSGEVVIPLKFTKALKFENGKAIVYILDKNSRYMELCDRNKDYFLCSIISVIDSKGKIIR